MLLKREDKINTKILNLSKKYNLNIVKKYNFYKTV